MIPSSFVENRSVSMRVLSDDQVYELRQAAFDVIEKVGCQMLHPGALAMLREAGAFVRDDIVKIPRHIVAEAIRTAPKGFTIYDRDGNRAMEVEGRKSYYGTSTASPNTRDVYSGEIRQTRVADIALGARVADALSGIDWVMPMGSSQDVPALAADVHEFEAVVTNTAKPIVFIGYSPGGVEAVFEMAAEVAGSLDRLRDRPFLILYPEPISPLVFPADVVDRIFVAADLFMPQIPGTSVQPGATGPVTLAGSVVQGLAEGLISLVLIQLRRPGAPCTLSANFGGFDMSTTQHLQAAPETSLALAAQAEVAQSFNLPSWGTAGAADSKLLDAQAGIEATFSILAQGMAGLNLIHDVGYMDRGMICSAEMLVMGDEIVGMARRFMRGIDVNADTLAREVIERVGPGGHFLQDDHTYDHFRRELWIPRLFARQSYPEWELAGSKDMASRVQERVHEILENHEPRPLPDKTLATLAELKLRGEKRLTSTAAA